MLEGEAGVVELVRESGADTVLNAIVGAAGLAATLATFDAGADLALANKESLVAGGAAGHRRGRARGPHDPAGGQRALGALAVPGGRRRRRPIESLVVTASGGPFRGAAADRLAAVTPDQALAHPTWSMGAKITIDSATLMNKGLEVIEAHFLFGVPYDRIEVVVHPQSIVHAMVRFRDGALLAHLGLPDMRVPISYALTHPERAATPAPRLDLGSGLELSSSRRTLEVFRCLALARAAGEAGGTAPCALNAANEVAVAAFLAGGLPFPGIADVVERVLDQIDAAPVESLEQVLETDRLARRLAGDAWR